MASKSIFQPYRSDELCIGIVQLLKDAGFHTDVVNNNVTADSPCEHELDVDVTSNGHIFNVSINIIRFN